MNTIITLEGVPFEGFEHANFIASLIKLFEDFNIPKENIKYYTDLEQLNKALKCLYDVEEYNEKVVQAIGILETLKGA